MCFNPLNKLDTNLIKIAPTEYDTYWRGAVLKGYVHDPTAALFGGEAGSAGLFSSAKDVGVFCQMILNGGEYGGRRYIRDTTIALFTCLQPDSERLGLINQQGTHLLLKHTIALFRHMDTLVLPALVFGLIL